MAKTFSLWAFHLLTPCLCLLPISRGWRWLARHPEKEEKNDSEGIGGGKCWRALGVRQGINWSLVQGGEKRGGMEWAEEEGRVNGGKRGIRVIHRVYEGRRQGETGTETSDKRPPHYITRPNIYYRNKQKLKTYFHASVCFGWCVAFTVSVCQTEGRVGGVFIAACWSLFSLKAPCLTS